MNAILKKKTKNVNNGYQCYYMSVKQKAISMRIYHDILFMVDSEAGVGDNTRNRILNNGARMYCELQDMNRRVHILHDLNEQRYEVLQFLRRYAPNAFQVIKLLQ